MEVEFALTIQHTQSKLEKYKKENNILKHAISQLKTERENLQVTVNEHTEKIKQKEVEILQLMECFCANFMTIFYLHFCERS